MQRPGHSSSTSFFFNATATTEIYTLSLHDALPIFRATRVPLGEGERLGEGTVDATDLLPRPLPPADRKSIRLNSSHANISYAVFCLKKKKITTPSYQTPSLSRLQEKQQHLVPAAPC